MIVLALLLMCPSQRSEGRQSVAQQTKNKNSITQLRKSPYASQSFVEWAKQCDDLEDEEIIRINNLPSKPREKAWKSLKRKTDVPSHIAPMWRDVSNGFDESSTNGMFEQIFEIMMEEHDGCDVEEYELMVEQFNLFAGRVALELACVSAKDRPPA